MCMCDTGESGPKWLQVELVGSKKEQHARQLAEKTRQAFKDINVHYVQIGGWLRELEKDDLFATLEDDEGHAFATLDEFVDCWLGWGRRKRETIQRVHEVLVDKCGLNPSELAGIGWNAAYHLCRLPLKTLKKSLRAWLDKATKLSVRALKAAVDAELGKADATSPPPKSFSDEEFTEEVFHLAPKQLENVQLGIKVAEKVAGSDKRGHLLDLVMTEFLAQRAEEAPAKLKRHLDNLERVFHCKLIAIRDADENILYGAKVAKQYGVS